MFGCRVAIVIDIDNPEHVDALKWACEEAQHKFFALHEIPSDARGLAWHAIHDAACAAVLTRNLLARAGITVVEHGVNRGTPDFPYVSVDDGQRYDNGDLAPLYVSRSLKSMPALIRDLLNVCTADAAMAALKGSWR